MSAVCYGCAQLANLDLTSTAAPFMWAIGPVFYGGSLMRFSDSPNYPLRIHSGYAQFTMDMTQATVDSNPTGQLPSLGQQMSGAIQTLAPSLKSDFKTPSHGALIVIGLLLLLPMSLVIGTCIRSPIVNGIILGFVFIFALIGFILGFLLSPLYLRVSLSLFSNSASS